MAGVRMTGRHLHAPCKMDWSQAGAALRPSCCGQVIKRRDSASLHLPLCIANAVNVACWLSYGVVRPWQPMALPAWIRRSCGEP